MLSKEKIETIKKFALRYEIAPKEMLEVTAILRTPFSSVWKEISFDGILFNAASRVILEEDYCNHFWQEDKIDLPLPLKKEYSGDKWFWSCSFGLYDAILSTLTWKKRWDDKLDDIVQGKERIDYKGGFYKCYNQPMVIRDTRDIVFYAEANQEELENLLGHATHIGKKTATGFGEVRRWLVRKIKRDSAIKDQDLFLRPVPVPEPKILPGTKISFQSYKPPYWARENMAFCYSNKN